HFLGRLRCLTRFAIGNPRRVGETGDQFESDAAQKKKNDCNNNISSGLRRTAHVFHPFTVMCDGLAPAPLVFWTRRPVPPRREGWGLRLRRFAWSAFNKSCSRTRATS